MSKVTCEHCKKDVEEKPRRTFLGFQRYVCQSCHKPTIYPLTSGYKIIYWAVIIIFLLALLSQLLQGYIIVPGLLTVGAIIGLIKDNLLQKKILQLNEKQKDSSKGKNYSKALYDVLNGKERNILDNLENKIWYRLVKVIYGLGIGISILLVLLASISVNTFGRYGNEFDFKGFISMSIILIIGVLVAFKLIKHLFFYVVTGKAFPKK